MERHHENKGFVFLSIPPGYTSRVNEVIDAVRGAGCKDCRISACEPLYGVYQMAVEVLYGDGIGTLEERIDATRGVANRLRKLYVDGDRLVNVTLTLIVTDESTSVYNE